MIFLLQWRWQLGLLLCCSAGVFAQVVPTGVLEKNPELRLQVDLPVVEMQGQTRQHFYLGQGNAAAVNRAVVERNWDILPDLLADYRQSADFEQTVHDYALGAWYRSQLRHGEAIALYRRILVQYPDADYLRFDLGVMLFEDRQYKEAAAHIQASKVGLAPELQEVARHYLQEMEKRAAIKPYVTANFEKNNNVNNASSAESLEWQGRTWHKSPDSLPKKAMGLRYGAGISKDINMYANHHASVSVELEGLHYWDNPDYNEQTLALSAGYKYQDVKQNLSLMPFAQRVWLDGQGYYQELGIRAAYNRRLNSQLSAHVGLHYSQKDYADTEIAKRFDSEISRLNLAYRYRFNPQWTLFGGADLTYDHTQAKENASLRYGIHMGLLAQTAQGAGGQISVRYAQRDFQAKENLLYGFARKDKEYYLQAAFWHQKMQYHGFMPKLHIHYHRIDSNMEALYSRDAVQSFISVEKSW